MVINCLHVFVPFLFVLLILVLLYIPICVNNNIKETIESLISENHAEPILKAL